MAKEYMCLFLLFIIFISKTNGYFSDCPASQLSFRTIPKDYTYLKDEKILLFVTLEKCCEACVFTTTFKCISFDYERVSERCCLSIHKKGMPGVSMHSVLPFFTYYEPICNDPIPHYYTVVSNTMISGSHSNILLDHTWTFNDYNNITQIHKPVESQLGAVHVKRTVGSRAECAIECSSITCNVYSILKETSGILCTVFKK